MAWAPDYVTTAELGAFVRIPTGDVADDAQMGLAISAASRAIDLSTQRQFGQLAALEDRYYTARYDATRLRWTVRVDDLMTTTGLVVKFDSAMDGTYATTIAPVTTRPVNAATRARPWEWLVVAPNVTQPYDLESGVRVTARWGWTAVPSAVKQACLLQSSRLLTRRDSPYGIAGSPEAGSEMRLLAKLDPDVEVSLAPYRRRPWVFG